jgi:hypothetical protein
MGRAVSPKIKLIRLGVGSWVSISRIEHHEDPLPRFKILAVYRKALANNANLRARRAIVAKQFFDRI